MLNFLTRPDRAGLTASAVLTLVPTFVVNGVIFATGWPVGDPAYDAISYSPPGWLVGLIWSFIYPMWGAALWYAWHAGAVWAGRLIMLLILWGLIYPFVVGVTRLEVSVWASVFSLALGIAVCLAAGRTSKTSIFWMIPSLLWMSFACVLGFAALANAPP